MSSHLSNRSSSIVDPLYEAASVRPEALAVLTPERAFRYGDLERWVAATAQRLQALGGGPGARIGLCLPTTWRALVLTLAAIRAGCVACPISMRLPSRGVAGLLRKVAARALITDREALKEQLPGDLLVLTPEEIVEEGGGGEEAAPRIALAQPATLVFTSGSTGEAKAVLHSVGNHYCSARGANENIALEPGDRWLLALPLYHVGGLGVVFRCLLAGATVVVPAPGLATGEAIRRYGVTHVSLVATQLARLLDEAATPEGLKAVLVGGSAVPPSLIREAHARGLPVHTTYGLTEMTSQVTTTPPGASLARLGTSGRRLPHRHVQIAKDGEILVKGAVLFQGYVDGKALNRPLDADGWFHTGDRGLLDAEGFLRVLGRTDTLFISGGENIHPEEIEQALCALDEVRQAVVVPVEDAVFGQRPLAFVKMDGGVPERAALAARLEPRLPRFKIPIAFYEWPDDAPAPGMKIDRAFFATYAERVHRAEL